MTDLPGDDRTEQLLSTLEQMAGGDLDLRIPISGAHDNLDAIAHGINMLVGELQYATAKLLRAKDESDAANQAKTVFIRNVSHELRTPLAAVLSTTQLLLEADLTVERRAALHQRILSNGTALLTLVDDLLDFSKLDMDRLTVELHPFSVIGVLADIIADLEPEAHRKGLMLSLTSTEDAGLGVLADARRVRQVVTNVLGNAVKFTEDGQVCVQVTAEGLDRVCVDITDTGIGLDNSQAAGLFQPFTQADASIGKRFGGSGLGLALSRRLARSMGGELELVRSAPGAGATFRLTLQAWLGVAGAVREAPPAATVTTATPAALAGVRVLLAEDDPDIRDAMSELLQRLGAQTTAVENGLEAVDRCSGTAFDILLLDVRMPGLDGLAVTRRLRAHGLPTPIVAITADAVREHRNECLAAGCDAYLTKPVVLDELIATIQRLCVSSSAVA